MKTTYSALFRIILIVLTVIPAFSSNGQTSSDNSSNSDAMTISLYSGIGDVNLGGLTGVGTEWMFRNISANFSVGRGNDTTTAQSRYGYHYDEDYTGISMGIKVYNSNANSKNRIFGGINYVINVPDDDYYYYYYYDDEENVWKGLVSFKRSDYIAITAGYRHTTDCEIYISPYAGMRLKYEPVCYGLNVGYQFKPIYLKYRKNNLLVKKNIVKITCNHGMYDQD